MQTVLGEIEEVHPSQRKKVPYIYWMGMEATANLGGIQMATGVESKAEVLNPSAISVAIELLKRRKMVIG